MKKILVIPLLLFPLMVSSQFPITNFTAITSLDSNDVFYVVDNELNSRKVLWYWIKNNSFPVDVRTNAAGTYTLESFWLGEDAGLNHTSGAFNNVGIGPRVHSSLTSGEANSGLGAYAGNDVTGNYNTHLGAFSGDGQTTASGTVKIGYQTGLNDNTSNTLWIDNSSDATPLIYGIFDDDSLVVNGDLYITGDLVTGSATNNWSLKNTASGQGSSKLFSRTAGFWGGIEIVGYDNDDWTGDSSRILLSQYALELTSYDGGDAKKIEINQDYLKITDAQDDLGAYYASDYSGSATDRWLADKGYVDGAFNSGSGITIDGSNNIDLGGTLDANAIITTGDGSLYFRVQSPYTSGTSSAQLSVDVGQIELASYPTVDYTGTTWSKIRTTKTEARSQFNDAGSEKSIVVNGTDMLVTDVADTKGLYYAADYSAGETDRWIPDKGYVDAAVGSGYNSGSGITIDGSDNIDLGGALDAATYITGAGTNAFAISSTSGVGGNSRSMQWDTGEGIYLETYTDNDYTGDYGLVSIGTSSTANIILSHTQDGGSAKSIQLTNTQMLITDNDDGIGLQYNGDYSAAYTTRSLVDKEYADLHLGAQNLNSTVYSPTGAEHGGVVTYDSTGLATGTDFYTITDVVSVGSAAGMMIVAFDTILYSNTSATTIVTLPVGAVIHDIFVYVATTFNGSGTDLLDIGVTGTGNHYEDNLDLAVGASFPTMTLTNVRDRMGASTNVIFQYFDANTDASAGEAYVYIQYSIH